MQPNERPSKAQTLRPGVDERPQAGKEVRPRRDLLSLVVLLTVTGAALVGCIILVRPFIPALTWAMTLAVLVEPVHARLARRVRWRAITAGLCVLATATLLLGPAAWIANVAGRQLYDAASQTSGAGKAQTVQQTVTQSVAQLPWGTAIVNWFKQHVLSGEEWQSAAETVAKRAASLLSGTVWAGAQFLVMLFVLFYLLRDSGMVVAGLRRYLPLSEPESTRIFDEVVSMIHATVFGTMVVSGVQGFLGGLMFWWLGIQAAAFWGLVMAVLALVPMAGAFLVWFPASIMFLLQGDWTRGLILLAWGATAVSLIDNLLYPLLVGREMRLHTLLVFFAMVGGIVTFGSTGVILGPILLTVTLTLLDIWRMRAA